ncbi:hypothetical protein DDP54_02370 [Cellulomonas sp. WB94]|nr:hypothetical protein DDP54_02370 [Cellulomonas sp. WB94]
MLSAIADLREVRVKWRSKDDGGQVQVRRCAPMDYGPSRRASDPEPRYHFWDFESDSGRNHVLSLRDDQIVDINILDTSFEPATFVTWSTSWFVKRTTWGSHN